MPALSGFREARQCMGEADADATCLGTEDLEYEHPESTQSELPCGSRRTKPSSKDQKTCAGDILKYRDELENLECTIERKEAEVCGLQGAITKLTALQTDTAKRLRNTCKRLSHAKATENEKLRRVTEKIQCEERTLQSKLAQKDDGIKKAKAAFASRDEEIRQTIENKRLVLKGVQRQLHEGRKELRRFQNSCNRKICSPISAEKQTSQHGRCRTQVQLEDFHTELNKIRQDKCEMESLIQECTDDLGRAVKLPNEIQHIKRFLRSLHVCDNSNRNTADDFDEDMVSKARQIIQMQQKLLEIHEASFMLQVRLKDMCCKEKIFRIAAAADGALVFRNEEPTGTSRYQEPAHSVRGVAAETPLWTACVLNPSRAQTTCCLRTKKATGVSACKASFKQEEPEFATEPCEASWAEAFLRNCSNGKQRTSESETKGPLIRAASFLQSETDIRHTCRVASLPVAQRAEVSCSKECCGGCCKCHQPIPNLQRTTPCGQKLPREAALEEDQLFVPPPRTAETYSPCPVSNKKDNLFLPKAAIPKAAENPCRKNGNEEHYAFQPFTSKCNFAKPVKRSSIVQVREKRPTFKKHLACTEVCRDAVYIKPPPTEIRKPECGVVDHPTTLPKAKSSTWLSSSASEILLRRCATKMPSSRKPKRRAPKQENCRKPTIPAEFVGPCCGKACGTSGIADTGLCRPPQVGNQTPANSDNVSESKLTSDVWSTCAGSSENASNPAGETTESDDEVSRSDNSAKKLSFPALRKNWHQIARSLLTSPAQETYARLMAERPVASNRHPFRHCHTPLESCDDLVDTSFSAAQLSTPGTRSACGASS